MRWVAEGKGDLVISDVMMPDGNGLEALPEISKQRPNLPVIIISAQNTITTAIQATEADAYDYLPKPFDLPDLMKRSARALDRRRVAKPTSVEQPQDAVGDDLPLIGKTPVMQALYRLIARVMNTELSVMITGESGTGKSLIARAIHDFSDRRNLPFVKVTPSDMAAIEGPAAILSRAKGGSILFDEVSDLDHDAQSRIVRMLDSLTDDAPRIMATSQQDLMAKMESGVVRQDLYYRLNGVTLTVPSLRERVDDIALLTQHFIARADRELGTKRSFAAGALELIRAYSWPGNVRQLENTVRRLVVTAPEEVIGRAEVEAVLGAQPNMEPMIGSGDTEKLSASVSKHLRRYFDLHGGVLPPPGLYQRILREIEMPLLELALEATGGNQAKCADLLGINRNTLRKKVTELDIRVTRRRKLM
jgi:two-component system nitrogen regulation response regulator GlnG